MIQFTGDNFHDVMELLYPLIQKGWFITHIQSIEGKQQIKITKGNNIANIDVGNFIKFNEQNDLVIFDRDPTVPVENTCAPLIPEVIVEFERLINIFLGESVRLEKALDIISEIMDVGIRTLKNDRIHIDVYVCKVEYDEVSESIRCYDVKTIEK